MIKDHRDFCIATMEVLDEWCEENGFETSDYIQVEFAHNLAAKIGVKDTRRIKKQTEITL